MSVIVIETAGATATDVATNPEATREMIIGETTTGAMTVEMIAEMTAATIAEMTAEMTAAMIGHVT